MATDDFWEKLASSLPEESKKKKRKKHRIACGQCGALMNLRKSIYKCPRCNCTHRAHPDGTPTGTPCDAKTGKARSKAHKAFDALWLSGRINRKKAYIILKRIMGITADEAHIGLFTKEQCEYLIHQLKTLGEAVFNPPYNTDGFL